MCERVEVEVWIYKRQGGLVASVRMEASTVKGV